MALADEVADFLLSRQRHISYAIGNLDFYVDRFHVEPQGFREMGNLIRMGNIRVEPPSRSSRSAIAAVYTPALNKLSIAPGMDLAGTTPQAVIAQSQIIHEMTHALMDFHHYQTTGTMQEVAAYLSGGIYAHSHFISLTTTNPDSNRILTAARQVIQSHRMLIDHGVVITRSQRDVDRLARAIEAHPNYPDSSRIMQADGIETTLLNPWYMPRHL